jgi:hypothetical protein
VISAVLNVGVEKVMMEVVAILKTVILLLDLMMIPKNFLRDYPTSLVEKLNSKKFFIHLRKALNFFPKKIVGKI